MAQQTISSSTTSTVTATGGDIVVNSGVTVGSSGTTNTPIIVDGVYVGSLTNNGSMLTSQSNGSMLYFNSTAPLATITNNGTMTSKGGIQLRSAANIINNSSMLGTDRGITIYATATGSSITNNAYLNAFTQSYAAISNQSGSTLVSVTNGTGGWIRGLVPIENNGVITTLTNRGNISSIHWVASNAIGGSGSITTLVNYGSITGANGGAAIGNSVTHLANAQGGASPLTIANQPVNYSIIINSPTSYGKLSVLSATAPMSFDVYAGSSFVSNYYYASVLSGITAANLSNTSGTYNGTAWTLSLASGSTTTWDLCFGGGACSYTLSSNILTGQTYSSSNLGTSVNRSFDGGTLQMASGSTVAGDFTLTANGGTIDQRGYTSTFTGNFSDATVGAGGKLIISNTGTAGQGAVTLAGTNTHTGGTEVQAGAKLIINSPSALGTGRLDLVGSATVPAALGTTATMTIANAITVAGDPIFNVAPGTTLTISSPIADGVTPGDIEVEGGGTLRLTAANTYTGPTIIDAGSTLALAGAGSIATSSAVTNNGTFDLTAASNPVSLGGSFTQSASGNLVTTAAPAAFQRLAVAGAATLDGTLTINASAGTYSMGRYRLLSANGVNGRFATLSTNLGSITPLGYYLSYDANDVYLTLAPSSSHTLQSVEDNARQLAGLYGLQAATLQAGLSYDCSRFDSRGLCVGVGGRYSRTSGNQIGNLASAQAVLGYRAAESIRVGAFIDASGSRDLSANLRLGANRPMLGVFGQWNQHADGRGLAVRASAAFARSELTITRSGNSYSEAGRGDSRLSSQGYQVLASFAYPLAREVTAAPYVGARYHRIRAGGYAEGASAQVGSPLSYDALTQTALAALAGYGVQARFSGTLSGSASVGVKHYLHHTIGAYAGSSDVPGLGSFSVRMPAARRTMATASAGLAYDLGMNQRLGVNMAWQQQAIGPAVLTVSTGYTVGF